MGKLDDSIEAAQSLIDLIDSAQQKLDTGKKVVGKGKETADYAKKITDWVSSGEMKQEEAEKALLYKKEEAFKKRYRIMWLVILVITVLICVFL